MRNHDRKHFFFFNVNNFGGWYVVGNRLQVKQENVFFLENVVMLTWEVAVQMHANGIPTLIWIFFFIDI